jgi:putative transcriptional regulator
MTKRYKSDAMAAIHETMESLHEIGAIDKQTMRQFDESCLTPIHPLTPAEIRTIREKEHVSQSVFSHYLNVTTGLISKWERGEKTPSGSALKLLLIVAKKGLSAIS